jgi:hypothetical protein
VTGENSLVLCKLCMSDRLISWLNEWVVKGLTGSTSAQVTAWLAVQLTGSLVDWLFVFTDWQMDGLINWLAD